MAGAGGSGSTSAVSAETVTGWHVLKIEGYSQIKGLVGVGKRIKSGTFCVGGHTWRLSIFPDGHDDTTADWICVDLLLDRPAASSNGDVVARSKFALLDQFGEPVPSYTKATVFTFTSQDKSWGFHQFIKRKDLESSFIKEDSFRIRCDVTIVQEIRTKVITTERVAVPPPDLQLHLGDLLATKVGADVTFEVDRELFTAHRSILAARSSVFMAELYGSMKEKLADHVLIHDMEARVFKAMLHFIYTDSLPEIEGAEKIVMAQHLLVAADRYNLQRLKLICEDALCSSVDVSTAATTLVLAEQHSCHGLEDACFVFLKSPGNLREVIESDGFQHLKSSCPSLLVELLAKVAP